MSSILAFVGTAAPVKHFHVVPGDAPLLLCGTLQAARFQSEEARAETYSFHGRAGRPHPENTTDLAVEAINSCRRSLVKTPGGELPFRPEEVCVRAVRRLQYRATHLTETAAEKLAARRAIAMIERDGMKNSLGEGHLYTVAVNASTADMTAGVNGTLLLDWDRPISEQMAVWLKVENEYEFNGHESGQQVFEHIRDFVPGGTDLRRRPSSVTSVERKALARTYLAGQGIVGCRFLDERSRFVVQVPDHDAPVGTLESCFRAWRGADFPEPGNEREAGFEMLEWGRSAAEVREAVFARSTFTYSIYDSSCLTITRRDGVAVALPPPTNAVKNYLIDEAVSPDSPRTLAA